MQLPPVHLVPSQCAGTQACLKFALLWPENVLSLSILSAGGSADSPFVANAYSELAQTWFGAEDMDTWNEAIAGTLYMEHGDSPTTDDELNRLAASWYQNYPQRRATRFVSGVICPLFFRRPIDPNHLATIQHPVLIVHVRFFSLARAWTLHDC